MKKFLVVCLLLLLYMSQRALATKQEGHIIYINGQEWRMQTEPVASDTALFNKMMGLLPKDRVRTTANNRGYTSYWSLHQDCLCLDSICISKYDKATGKSHYECIPKKEMHRVFADCVKDNRIIATWFTNELKVSRGKYLYRHPEDYKSDFYEEETKLTIKEGRVTEKRTYRNSLFNGYSLEGEQGLKVMEIIKEKKLFHPEKYPELESIKRIVFRIEDVQVDAKGCITDCTVTAMINPNDKWENHVGIAEEMKQALMSLYPWKILCVDGKYVSCGIDGYTIPYHISSSIGNPDCPVK